MVQIDELYRIQKKCMQMLTNSNRKAHAAPLFKQLRLLNVYDINKLQIACFVYKSMNYLLPHCLTNFFESNNTVHDYNLRNNRNIKLHQSTINVRFFSIKCNGPRIWNDIDISIRDARHVDIFKVKLKPHYLESYI